jgi:hypothetical protein
MAVAPHPEQVRGVLLGDLGCRCEPDAAGFRPTVGGNERLDDDATAKPVRDRGRFLRRRGHVARRCGDAVRPQVLLPDRLEDASYGAVTTHPNAFVCSITLRRV